MLRKGGFDAHLSATRIHKSVRYPRTPGNSASVPPEKNPWCRVAMQAIARTSKQLARPARSAVQQRSMSSSHNIEEEVKEMNKWR